MSEADLEQQVMAEASRRGHRLFKNPVGFYKKRAKNGQVYAIHYGAGGRGSPDLWGWTRDGHFVAIEMKKPGERPKKHQNDWREAALLACPTLRIGWADSVERAMEILEGPRAVPAS